MRYPSLADLLDRKRADLGRGPLSLVLAEDDVALNETLAHQQACGFRDRFPRIRSRRQRLARAHRQPARSSQTCSANTYTIHHPGGIFMRYDAIIIGSGQAGVPLAGALAAAKLEIPIKQTGGEQLAG